jgi:hypothetical protein
MSKRCHHSVWWASVLALVLLVSAAPAEAHFDTATSKLFYSLFKCPFVAKTWRDPVNVVFYKNGTKTHSLAFVSVLGWTNTTGFKPSFKSHLVCGVGNWLRASASPTGVRFVLAARQTYHADIKWKWTTIAVARREKHVGSCQAVAPSPTGYDDGRVQVKTGLPAAGFRSTFWGNTHSFKSPCDGTWSESDGYTYWFLVP